MKKLYCNQNTSKIYHKINCFKLQLITNEIYMTTKLIVAPWKWRNGCAKEKCKRKMKKMIFFIFLFRYLDGQ